MKTTVISYSLTGNNDALAASLAKALGAEHARVTERGKRGAGKCILDVIFNRTPKVVLPSLDLGAKDLIVFVAPVWAGEVAIPLRACFRQLAPTIGRYAFVSICGGAHGPNLKIAAGLTKRLGTEPIAVVDLYITDLLPGEPKPTSRGTSAYRVKAEDVKTLTEKAVDALRKLA